MFSLVLVFKTKKHSLAKPGFIRDLLKDKAPQSACATGVELLGRLHSPSLQGTVNTLVQNRPCYAGLIVNTLLSSKIKLPCLSAISLSGESGQSHSRNVFNKNSNKISFHLSTVEYNFKLNNIALLQALCRIGRVFFSLKLIWLQMDNHSVAYISFFMLRAKQNLRNGVHSRSEPV